VRFYTTKTHQRHYTRNAVVHNGVLDPGANFIAKPFTFDRLGQKIREVLS
jgi:hypothetical protein